MGSNPTRVDPSLTAILVVMIGKSLVILLLEDESHDITFVEHAIEQANAGHRVYPVQNGEEAIRYLRGEDQFAERERFPLPNVILTDLKMPVMNGFEFLHWLRSHPECAVIPTIVYSTSRLETDVREAYRSGASAYIQKPSQLNDLVDVLRSLCDFWSKCECPPLPSGC